jgi:hypothetical protein
LLLLLLLPLLLLLLLLLGMHGLGRAAQQQDFGLGNVKTLPRRRSKGLHGVQKRRHSGRRRQVHLRVVRKLRACQRDPKNCDPHTLVLQKAQKGFSHT